MTTTSKCVAETHPFIPTKSCRQQKGRDEIFDRPIQRELIFAKIELPLTPSASNEEVLKLRGQGLARTP